MKKADQKIIERAREWLSGDFDQQTRLEVQKMLDHDPGALTDAFYTDLSFGTGGLRGIMGAGTNRMNRYTVGKATQGLANYLLKSFPHLPQISVAIAHDSRHQSDSFTQVSADILSANGIKVYVFDGLRPVPLLSFAVRQLKCQSGIVITASHNPKEYNGYKVYWDDGGQLVPPHDQNVIEEVKKITSLAQVHFGGKPELIEVLGKDFDEAYIGTLKSQSLSLGLISKHNDLKIVFTPIHGAAVNLVPMAMRAFGFRKVYNVPEQDITNGDFPTVISPNPEESAALSMALKRGEEVGAELVMATDPDGDRVGLAIRDLYGTYVLLNGNQTASLLFYYILEQWKIKGKITGKEYIVKTIVTSGLLKKLAVHYGVECVDVLTGFKYIAEIIRNWEGEKTFIAGGEESYGYLVGDYVRDKDAIISCCMLAEAAVWAREQGKSMFELLIDIYLKFGFFYEKLFSITKKGKEGMETIKAMMEGFRNNVPEMIDGKKVVEIIDYRKQSARDLMTGSVTKLELPPSNVIQYVLDDETIITMRPSGTEPKIKFYFGCQTRLKTADQYDTERQRMDNCIDRMMKELDVQ
jgi:phosphoglucomutase